MGQQRAISVSDDGNEIGRLTDKLARLAAAAEPMSGDARVLRGDSPRALLAAILREVDETILARTLEIRTPEGGGLSIDVYSRRVLRVNAPVPPGAPEGIEGLSLADAGPEIVGDLLSLLQAFIAESSEAHVNSRPVQTEVEATEYGLAASSLAAMWEMELCAAEAEGAETRIRAFFNACEEQDFCAILYKGRDAMGTAGRGEPLEQLHSFGETALSAMRKNARLIKGPNDLPRFVTLGSGVAGDSSAMMASEGDHLVLVAVPADRLGTVTALWRKTFL